jgi:hydrogenase expression/formation protein HypE
VIEEGFARADLDRILASMRAACAEARAAVIAGDTKVMGAGEIDGLVINTSGIGLTRRLVRDCGLEAGDRLIVTGTIGDHGMAIMAMRHGLQLDADLRSDVAPLNGLIRCAMEASPDRITAMKDPTRGGIAAALHEMVGKSHVGVIVETHHVVTVRRVRVRIGDRAGVDPVLFRTAYDVYRVQTWCAAAPLEIVDAGANDELTLDQLELEVP